MEILLLPETWLSLLALSFIEIVLGVDNLVFIAIVTSRLPATQQKMARRLGLSLAMLMRLGLLAFIFWLASLQQSLFHISQFGVSIRDMILWVGGLFLLIKSAQELAATRREEQGEQSRLAIGFSVAITQIILFDILFSLDSVITAVGIANHYLVMAVAIVVAVLVMLMASEPVARFINSNPRIKVLALAILILVGCELILKGFHLTVGNAYLFMAMGFALFVELLNQWVQPARH